MTNDFCLGMNFRNLSGWYLRSKGEFPKCTTYLINLQKLLRLKAFSTHRLEQNNEFKNLTKAHRVIDLVSSKPTRISNQGSHLQLIQDFLQTHSKHFVDERFSSDLTSKSQKTYDQKHPIYSVKNEDPIFGVSELHREGLRIDVAMFSHALSACACKGDLHFGIQLQCLSIREGFLGSVYVGSSLISMYSKYGDTHSAFKVFEEMPVRNIVSWTALISGYAQECQVDVCLELYTQMRNSSLKPNEFTLTSLLSACVGSGSLIQGRSVHCQSILSGVDSDLHVANALISMYCKCGNVEDAFCVFEAMHDKDVVSWNSMIAGYALHGLVQQAIDLFEEMKKLKIKPDGITFLGVLSSCRHAGLVDQGRVYFNSMLENGVTPNVSHYSCIVDLLGRAGLMEEARDFVLGMPIEPNAIIWGSLLSSCRLHDNVWIGIEAAESRLALEPSCAATHVQLTKLYARVGLWGQVAKVLKFMKDTQVKTNPGYSWIEIGNEIYRFGVNDTSNSRMNEVLSILNTLMDHLAVSYTVAELDRVSHGL